MRLSEAYSVHQTPANEKPGEMISHSSGFFLDGFAMCETKKMRWQAFLRYRSLFKLPGPELLRLGRGQEFLRLHCRLLQQLRLLLPW